MNMFGSKLPTETCSHISCVSR